MRRRDLLKAATALLLPTIDLRPFIDRERLMRPFCDTENLRYDCTRPFLDGEMAYATDSRRLIRGYLDGPALAGAEVRVPPVSQLFDRVWRDDLRWREFQLPAIEQLIHRSNTGNCPACDNRRIVLPEYPEWNHEGRPKDRTIELLDYDIDDNSIRDASCPVCRGRRYDRGNALELDGTCFDYTFLKPVAAIPQVEWAVVQADLGNRYCDPRKLLFFRSQVCELSGMVCPLDAVPV